jgi:hypothetical protein
MIINTRLRAVTSKNHMYLVVASAIAMAAVRIVTKKRTEKTGK